VSVLRTNYAREFERSRPGPGTADAYRGRDAQRLAKRPGKPGLFVKRETGLEPATLSLEGCWHPVERLSLARLSPAR
jgi:hypothetical protein